MTLRHRSVTLALHRSYKPLGSVLAFFLFLLLAACERPFVPPRVPEIEVVEPSLDRLFFDSPVVLKVRATSFRSIERLELNGSPMLFVGEDEVWVDTVRLEPGVNDLRLTAFDVEDFSSTQRIEMAFLRPRFDDDAPQLPNPWRVGGHTATLLSDESILVTGGAGSISENARPEAFHLPRFADEFVLLENKMNGGRIGHTATLLPDGRVLIVGGSSTAALVNASSLVDTAVLFDPDTQDFIPIPFAGTPLERAYHVTFLSRTEDALLVDIYGGLGRAPLASADVLTARNDFVTYSFQDDMLVESSASGETLSGIEGTEGLTNILTTPGFDLENARYLVSGSRFVENGSENVNFTIDFSSFTVDILPELTIPRIRHAAAAMDRGLFVFIGGFQGTRGTTLNSSEVYFESLDRFIEIDDRLATRPRFSHTATKLNSQRILVLGGFNFTGEAVANSQYLLWR